MLRREEMASTVYVPRTSVSPPSCMQKPPQGCFMRRKKAYRLARGSAA
jgi:hypothetical protein